MKNMIVNCLVLASFLFFSLLFSACALSESDPLDRIVIEDGWMRGNVTVNYLRGTEKAHQGDILIDCAEPASNVPMNILTVSRRFVSKKQMQQALKSAGQRADGSFVNPRGEARYTGDWNTEASADISKEEAASQAIEIGLAYFAALGVDVYPLPRRVSRPYDFDSDMASKAEFYTHRFSDASFFLAREESNWKRRSKYFPEQSAYTEVTFDLMLDGIRLAEQPSFPAGYADEPDAWEGFDASASIIVSDSGVLVEAWCVLLEVTKRRPAEGDPTYEKVSSLLPERHIPYVAAGNWRQALSLALQDGTRYQLGEDVKDAPYQIIHTDETVTAYGSKAIITDVYPFFHTISRHEWAPFWMIKTKQEYADGWRE